MNLNKKRKEKGAEKQAVDESKQAKSLLSEGKILYEKATQPHEFQQAHRLFSSAISKSSSAQILHLNHIYHLRGLCQFKLKRYDRAQRDFQQAISISDDKSKIGFYNSLGKCKFQQGNLIQKENSSNNAVSSLQFEEAIKCFQKSLQFSNYMDGDAFYNLGNIYHKLKKNFQAIKEFGNAVKFLKYNEQFQAYIERGICYRQIGEIQNSIDDFLKACQIKKDDPYAHFHLGINYLLNLNYDTALQKLSQAIQLNKTEPQFHNYKGLVLYMSGQYSECLTVFFQALKFYESKQERGSEVGECWYNVGNALLNLNQQTQALEAFNKAKQFCIDEELQIKIIYAEGRTCEFMNSRESVQKFSECLSRLSLGSDLYLATLYHLGLCQSKYNLANQAIQSFSKIIESDCNDKCVYQERGKVFLKNEMYKEALQDFQVVAGIDETYPDIYYYRGLSKVFCSNIDQALKDLFKAIELGSTNIGIFNGISCAYLHAKKYQKALIYSNICLSNHPSTEQFLIQRSLIYLELKEYAKSIEDLTTALQVNAFNPSIYYRRGLAYYKNKMYELSITDLEKALECMPNRNIQADIYYHIGIANSNLDKNELAIEPLTKALQIQKKAKFFHERAKCEILLQQNLQALNDLNQVIKYQPQNAFAYFRRGFAHKALKLYDQAAQDFLKARQLAPQDPRLIINKKQIYQTKYRKLCDAGEEQ